jgi:hypothetical protein
MDLDCPLPNTILTPQDKKSYLDIDDMNGPGLCKFPKLNGNPEIDFALFKINRYAHCDKVAERLLFVRELPRTARELCHLAEDYIPKILRSLVYFT